MTIAASVVVHSSPSLRLAFAGMSCAAGVAAALVLIDEFSDSVHLPCLVIGLICALLACTGTLQVFRSTKTFHIDISGIGQMRLTQYSGVSGFACASHRPLDAQGADLVQLLSDSTLWPHILVLRLKLEDGAVVAIPVLPDSVHGQGFHELSVACRWIAARA